MKRDLLTVAGLSVATLLLAFGPAVAGGEKGGVKSNMPSASPRLNDQKIDAPAKAPEPQQK